jgi:hypothetical protein
MGVLRDIGNTMAGMAVAAPVVAASVGVHHSPAGGHTAVTHRQLPAAANGDVGPCDSGGASVANLTPAEVQAKRARLDARLGSKPGTEIPCMRTATSDTYTARDGGLKTTESPDPINYQDTSGTWKPIDDDLLTHDSAYTEQADSDTLSVPATPSGAVTLPDGIPSQTMTGSSIAERPVPPLGADIRNVSCAQTAH